MSQDTYTAIYIIIYIYINIYFLMYLDFIQAWRIEKQFLSFLGRGGSTEGVSEEVKTLEEAPPPLKDLLPRTVNKICSFPIL